MLLFNSCSCTYFLLHLRFVLHVVTTRAITRISIKKNMFHNETTFSQNFYSKYSNTDLWMQTTANSFYLPLLTICTWLSMLIKCTTPSFVINMKSIPIFGPIIVCTVAPTSCKIRCARLFFDLLNKIPLSASTEQLITKTTNASDITIN